MKAASVRLPRRRHRQSYRVRLASVQRAWRKTAGNLATVSATRLAVSQQQLPRRRATSILPTYRRAFFTVFRQVAFSRTATSRATAAVTPTALQERVATTCIAGCRVKPMNSAARHLSAVPRQVCSRCASAPVPTASCIPSASSGGARSRELPEQAAAVRSRYVDRDRRRGRASPGHRLRRGR